jgi:AraC family transcriptional regulator, regulatory protein of adaptative response / methylated-DNA-[protein]-cysteine methyltransferase
MTVTAPDLWRERLRNRDTPEGASFVYGVVTTGVYCRPGCPSRLPRQENVRLFTSGEEAKRAGFRPCLRCQPDGPSLEERQAEAVSKACALIEAAEEKPDFDAVAKGVGMSRHHFHRVFKQTTGVTPGAYFNARRRARALDGLSRTGTVTDAIYGAGYSSSSRFYETCAPQLGLKPSAFAKGGAGEVIRFAVGECSLGSILVAATAHGICAIQLGDTAEELVEALQDRFPKADLKGGDADFEQIVARVVGLVEEPRRAFDLPLHVRGTAFQQRIWDILRSIPPGETMTYAEVAAKAGCPGAVRAVANACASNKLAVAIPCHRVVRKGGALSGYRWGVERKAALLKREGPL